MVRKANLLAVADTKAETKSASAVLTRTETVMPFHVPLKTWKTCSGSGKRKMA